MTNKQHAQELEAQGMMYPQGVVYDALMAGAAALREAAALRNTVAKIQGMRLCRQCAMAASFMAGGGGDGVVA
jgi:hypothetical protein